MCFVWIWEQTAIISLYSINCLVCITETECVYCAVRTGSLYIILHSPLTVYLCVLCGYQKPSEKQQCFGNSGALDSWLLSQPCLQMSLQDPACWQPHNSSWMTWTLQAYHVIIIFYLLYGVQLYETEPEVKSWGSAAGCRGEDCNLVPNCWWNCCLHLQGKSTSLRTKGLNVGNWMRGEVLNIQVLWDSTLCHLVFPDVSNDRSAVIFRIK